MAASTQMLHHLLRPPPPQPPPLQPPSSSFFSLVFRLKPLFVSATTTSTTTTATALSKSLHQFPRRTPTHFSNSLRPRFSHSFATLTPFSPPADHISSSLKQEEEYAVAVDDGEEEAEENFDEESAEDDGELESGSEALELAVTDGEASQVVGVDSSSSLLLKLPSLSVKEKKELSSYAHSLGKKLKSQLVGKSGVTANVASSFIETLESNELLKVKIHRTCPGELDDVVKQLEKATGSVVVGQIGRTVIVYRPSLTKLKAEEKKKQAQKAFARREPKYKHTLQIKEEVSRFSGRGRRGTSRLRVENNHSGNRHMDT